MNPIKRDCLWMNLSAAPSSRSARDWITLITLGVQPLPFQLIPQQRPRFQERSILENTAVSTDLSFISKSENIEARAITLCSGQAAWNWAANRSADQINERHVVPTCHLFHVKPLRSSVGEITDSLLHTVDRHPSTLFWKIVLCGAIIYYL